MTHQQKLENYASILLRVGLDLQKDQELVLNATLEAAPLVRILTRIAYEMGAKEVLVNWSDALCERYHYAHQSDQTLSTVHDWKADMHISFARRGCAYMRIASESPDAFADIDPKKIALARKSMSAATKEASNLRQSGKSPWLVCAYPGAAWAQIVFPQMSCQDAVSALWNAIFAATYADQPDGVVAWHKHTAALQAHVERLNAHNFAALHYKNDLGTDFTVRLAKDHVWSGGGAQLQDGRTYIPNMPTEEIFTAPDLAGAQGTLVSSLPLNHAGMRIEGIRLRFEKGVVVQADAQIGADVLRAILDTDDGAKRLGEVALIPCDCPLARMGMQFCNTLYDENTSCHFAVGSAYPECVRGGAAMDEAQQRAAGLNQSLTHVDFMVGTPDMVITGIAQDGARIPVFQNGVWA